MAYYISHNIRSLTFLVSVPHYKFFNVKHITIVLVILSLNKYILKP